MPDNDPTTLTTRSNTPVYQPSPQRASAARTRVRHRRVRSRRNNGGLAWIIIALAILGIMFVVTMSVTLLLRVAQSEQEIIPTAAAVVLPTPVDARISAAQPETQLVLNDGSSLALTPWNGTSRFTVLVMGLDRRLGETGLAYRTDTIMLVSLDPTRNSIGILSIPRDLYVEVPGYPELQRVNTPMVLGELVQPGTGPQLAMQTIQYNLGIRVHDFVAVDFQAFIEFVDTIGGIEIELTYNISDPLYPDMNYGYDPFYLQAGQHVLDGRTALKFARTRHGTDDFQRALRQQSVLYAVRERLLDPVLLPQMIVQAPALWGRLEDKVYTGLTLDQIIQLALYMKDIPEENIATGVINELYTVGYRTAAGGDVLIPNRAEIGSLMVEVFGPTYSE